MGMFRLIIVAISLLLVFIVSLICYPLSRLIWLINKHAGDVFALRFVNGYFRILTWLSGTDVEFRGTEYLPKDGEAVVYISDHQSLFDIVTLYPKLPGLSGFVAKAEIRKWPLVSWWLTAVHSLYLDRDNVRQGAAAILEGVENVKNGISMVIFPEGTRSKKNDEILPFHEGSFKLASKAKAKIIPVAIVNTAAVFEDHLPWIKRAKVIIEFCEPVDTAALTRQELLPIPKEVHDLIEEKVKANIKEIES